MVTQRVTLEVNYLDVDPFDSFARALGHSDGRHWLARRDRLGAVCVADSPDGTSVIYGWRGLEQAGRPPTQFICGPCPIWWSDHRVADMY